MFTHQTKLRVRYGETDQMGYVYYGNYALYYEVGRVEALRSLGLTYKRLEDQGILMPVVRIEAKYIKPAKYDDLIQITTTILELPSRFITFHVKMMNEENKLLHRAKVTLCFHDAQKNKAVSAPSEIVNVLAPYFEK